MLSKLVQSKLEKLHTEQIIDCCPNDEDKKSYTIALNKKLGLKPIYHTVKDNIGAKCFLNWLDESRAKNVVNW